MSTEFQQEQARIIAESAAAMDDEHVPRPGEHPMSFFARGIATDTKFFVKEMIAKAVGPLEQKITDLEQQVCDRPGLKYMGVFLKGVRYTPGDCVTEDGSLWVRTNADGDTPGPPGRDFAAWKLAVKKGRDGRAAREPGRSHDA